jgi:uncharacterized membrane protein YidH (DUF202 family)
VSRIPDRQALQPERTALAWQRTSLTAMVLVLPLVVVAVRLENWWLVVAGALATVTGALLVLRVRRRFDQLRDDSRGYSPFPVMLRVLVVTLMGAVLGIAAAVSAVLA